jgi:ketosteroid isomerase-like protein
LRSGHAARYCAGNVAAERGGLRTFYEAIHRGDDAEALACLAADVVYGVLQEGLAHGPDEVRAMWERWEGDWADGGKTVAEEFVGAGDSDQVVVTVHEWGRGRASGIEVDVRVFNVFTVRDGMVVDKREFAERSEALEAAALSE